MNTVKAPTGKWPDNSFKPTAAKAVRIILTASRGGGLTLGSIRQCTLS